jgi:putative ABC transport system permease protein
VTRFAIRGLLSRKLRTALTALAIVLGVAMISGTYVLTDSIDQAFDRIFTDIRQGSTAVITGRSAFDLSEGSGVTAPTFDESLLDEVRALPGVAAAEGSVDSDAAQLIGDDGKAVVYGGAPNLGFSIADGESVFNPLTLVEGAWPGPDEVIVDKETASKEDFEVGETIGVQVEGPVERLRVSGIMQFSSGLTIGGATLAGFDVTTAQRLMRKEGRLDEIAVAAKPGVSPEELVAQIEGDDELGDPILPDGTQVQTATEQVSDDASETNEFITFLQGFLLAFGGIALFVGSFVIANSLSITIAQRTRELATLRTLGASRRQVLGSILVESLVVGVVASVIGLFLGLLLAEALFWLFDAVGFTLPNTGLVFLTRTAIVALLAGILVTVFASLRPALRATRVPPIAAVREGATLPPGRFARFRGIGALVTIVLGFAALSYGLFASGLETTQILIWMGLGALLVFLGVALFSSRLVRPLAQALGWPGARFGGVAGGLARQNARRNPQRTASTAAALMIGLALVTLVATLAAGIVQTFRGAVDDLWKNSDSDYAITALNNFSPIPVDAADAAARTPGVVAVMDVRTGQVRAFGETSFATAVDPSARELVALTWKEGSQDVLADLGDDGAFVDDGYADDYDLEVGSPIDLTFPDGVIERYVVEGIFDPPTGGSPFGSITISTQAWDERVENPRNLYSFLALEGDVSDANTLALEAALSGFPNAKAQTREQFIDNQISGLNSILNILYVLLALSVLVSLFGIVNTLVLTVFERTREIGMLRAIGMTRRQIRRMIRWESVITALIGAVIGIILGIVLAALLIARVEFIDFAFPTAQVVVFVIAAIFVGIVAAVFPARRAAKLDPLQAISYE